MQCLINNIFLYYSKIYQKKKTFSHLNFQKLLQYQAAKIYIGTYLQTIEILLFLWYQILNLNWSDYAICEYNNQKWIGQISTYDTEFEVYNIKFLYPSGISAFYHYPEIKDHWNISKKNVIHVLTTKSLKAEIRRIQYSLC